MLDFFAPFHIILIDMNVCSVISMPKFLGGFNLMVKILKYLIIHNLCVHTFSIKSGCLFYSLKSL